MDITLLYNQLLAKVTSLGASVNVTYYTLSLGAQDATTGIPAKTYSVGTSIEMLIFGKAAQQMLTGTGIYIKTDSIAFSKVSVSEGDRILDQNSNYYEVTSVLPQSIGDIIVFYQVNLVYQNWIT